ncbi:hypothetical protein [Pseudonocardia sp. GCM10023141]|uniref:hypothetical protein n=1 Tax=Pseudonocardia sp. GCM10023141 TaxID=3252653 RepID=UPI003617BACF
MPSGDSAPADPSSTDAALDGMLRGEPPAVVALVQRLRRAVTEAHPDLQERVNTSWYGLAFHHPRAGYICALFPRRGGVNVGFEQGGVLHDPHGRLTGRGRTRDVRIEVDAGPDEDEIVLDYLDIAVDVAIDRAAHKAAKVRRTRAT